MRRNGKGDTASMKKRVWRGLNKRILSLFLAAAMLFGSADLTALATEPGVGVETPETPETPEQSEENQEEGAETPGTSEEETETPGDSDGGTETPGTSGEGTVAPEDSDEAAGEDGENAGEPEETPGEDDENAGEPEETPGEEEDADDTAEEEPEIAEENAAVRVMQDDLQIEAANGLGSLLMSDLKIAAQAEKDESAESYAVSDIEVSGTTARVMFHAAGSCTAVVVIYEEDSAKPYAFGSAVVPEGENQVAVEIEADSMPTYFEAKGYLVDTDSLRPLSREYCTVMYTRAMQEFLAKTADDFGDAPVLNLDEDINTNFLVLKEGNLLIKEKTGKNEGDMPINRLVSYDEASAAYTFANVDDSMKGLKSDDIFVYQYGENDYHIIKVKTIELQETEGVTAAVIVAVKEELSAEEVFQHVRIDQVSGTADMSEITQEDCAEGVTYLGRKGEAVGYAAEGDITFSLTKDFWEIEKEVGRNSGSVEGSLSCKMTAGFGATVNIQYYLSFTFSYVDVSFEMEATVEGEVSAEGEAKLPLVKTPLEFIDVEGLFIFTYTPKLVVGGKIKATVDMGVSGTCGLKLSKGILERATCGPYGNLKLDVLKIDGEASVYVGIIFDPELKVGDLFNAELECGACVGAEAAIQKEISVSSKEEVEKHECGIYCVAINGYLDIPLDGELKILKWKDYDLGEALDTELEGSLLKIVFLPCYYSIKHKKFGWDECPYKEYKAAIQVKTTAGQPIKGAVITYKDGQQECTATTGKEGQASIWLPAGRQAVNAAYGGVTKSKAVIVDGPKTVIFELAGVELGLEVEQFYLENGCTTAITQNGQLYMWGGNEYGEVGDGTKQDQGRPIKILENVKSVNVKHWHKAAITQDGNLYMWGWNSNGQIGNGDTTDQTSPIKILDNVAIVDTGGIGSMSSGAVTQDGSLYMWGYNGRGGIGNGTTEDQTTPVKVLSNVANISLGGNNCGALSKDGSLYMWGYNGFGNIGNGTTENQTTPIKILDNVKEVILQLNHSLAVGKDGSLYMWGYRGSKNQTKPLKILSDVESVCSEGSHDGAITKDGSLYMWGWNNYDGKVGNGTTQDQIEPVKVLDNVQSVNLGLNNSGAITKDGSLYMWGQNDYGQIGNGTTANQTTPIKILDNVVSVSFSNFGTVGAVTKDGSLYMWGRNDYRQIGNGTTTNQTTPVKILDNVESIVLDQSSSGAVTRDGSIYMWGSNSVGQLGNGVTDGEHQSTPQKVDIATNTRSTTSYASEPYAEDTIRLATQTDADITGSMASFTGLKPNDIHNVYAMRSRDSENQLGSENLLYITQAVSDGNGNLSVSYELRENCENPDIFCVGYIRTDLSTAQVSVPNIDYDGEEHLAEPTVVLDGQTLTEGTDYAVYGPCIVTEKGEYTLQIRGIGSYCGTKEVTFRVGEGDDPKEDDPKEEDPEPDDVLPGDIPSDGVIPDGLWIAGVNENGYSYTGKAIKPEVRVYDHKRLLVEKVDYTIAYKNNTKANDASVEKTAPTITVTGKGNYSGKDTKTFKILPLDIGQSTEDTIFEADDMAFVSNKKAQKPVPALLWNGKKLKNKTDYTFTYHNGTYNGTETEELVSVMDAGEYYITLTGKGNFAGTRRIKLTVLPTATDEASVKLISKTTVTKIPNQSYLALRDNGQVAPEVTVKDGKTTLTKDVHYTVSYSNNSKVGTAYAIITGREEGGYSGTKRVSFKITGVSISKAAVEGLSGQTFTYNGADIKPQLKLTVNLNGVSTELKEGTDYSVQWTKVSDAGTAAVVFSGINGYTGTLKKTYKIKAYNIAQNQSGSFKAELKSASVPYAKGGAKPQLNVTFRKADGSALSLKEGKDYTVAYRNNTAYNDGSNANKRAYVTVKGKGNFAGTYAEKLYYQITAQDIGKMTLTAEDKAYQNKKNYYATKVIITDLDGKALKAGTDYDKSLAYTYRDDTTLDNGVSRKAGESVDKNDVIPAGTVIKVTATPKGRNYTGTSVSGEYSIKPGSISGASVSIPKQTYTGRAITLKKEDITVKVKGKKLEPSQYEIVPGSYQNNVKKGTATVTIRGIDNYGGTKKAKFTIKAKGFLWWWKK